MEKIDFSSIRRAFRLLFYYQTAINDIVEYIGSKLIFGKFSNKNDWFCQHAIEEKYSYVAWKSFLNYIALYYIKHIEDINSRKWLQMGIFQISDDGCYSTPLISTEEAKSYLFLYITISASEEICRNIAWNNDGNNDWNKDRGDAFLKNCIINKNDVLIFKSKEDNSWMGLMKKYELERFINAESTDGVIKDFADFVFKHSNIKILKDDV